MSGAPRDGDDAASRAAELEELFAAYLWAADRGDDRAAELLARAGTLAPELQARIELDRLLRHRAPAEAPPPTLPRAIGRFEVLGLLGRGGISIVYLALDPQLGRNVALKVLERERLLDRKARAWMRNEARALAQIEHPNVVRVLEVGEGDEARGIEPFLAMELVTGPSLRSVIDELARPASTPAARRAEVAALAERLRPWRARLAVLRQLADALATCHDREVLHRDVKPHNVFFDASGTPRLIDFGLAHDQHADEDSRLGLTREFVGTAAYLAPEQARDQRSGADPRSDQFAFGLLAYEFLALEHPFLRPTQHATLTAIEACEPPSLRRCAPELPADLGLIVQHALEREPEARYPDLRALERDLLAVLEHRPVGVRLPSPAHLLGLWLRRHRRTLLLAGATAMISALLAGVLWSSTLLARRARVMQELARILPADFRTPADFEPAYDALLRLRTTAAELEHGLGGLVFPSLAPAVEAKIVQWSQRIDACYRAQTEGPRLQENGFRQLVLYDRVLCPEAPWNEVYRRRGRVDYGPLPPERAARLEFLETRVSVESFFAFAHAGPLEPYPIPGVYRVTSGDPVRDEILSEGCFFMPHGWPDELVLAPAPRGEVFHDARAFPALPVEFEGLDGALTLPPFRLQEHVVTQAEFARFRPLAPAERLLPGEADPGAPAVVSLTAAAAYCRHVGGRLPRFHELAWALAQAAVEPAAGQSAGEFLLDPPTLPSLDLGSWVGYDGLAAYRSAREQGRPVPGLPLTPVFSLGDPQRRQTALDGQLYGVAFRVAFTDGPWSRATTPPAPR